MAKITKRTVDGATPDTARRYCVWDNECLGFGVLILPSGVKSYLYRYRSPDGQERRATLGKHGALTPDQARTKAEEFRQLVADGGDPLKEKRERRDALTVAGVLDEYLASEAFAVKADSTKATDRGRIERHLKPLLGRRPVDQLAQEEIERAFRAIKEGKTALREKMGYRALANVRGGDGAARKSIRLLRSIFAWAVNKRLIKSNPAANIQTGHDGARDMILDDAEAYGRLFQTLDKMETQGRIRSPVADAFRVIALTGARKSEITGLRWKHVDLRAGMITLPRASHKTGRKTGKARLIGLPAMAQAVIARQPSGKPDDLVFLPSHGSGPISTAKPWKAVCTEAKLPAGFGLHGLRHSLASHLAMGGAAAAEIMTVMGHANLATSQGYIHWAQQKRQPLAEKAAAVALAGLAISGDLPSADVIKLDKGGSR